MTWKCGWVEEDGVGVGQVQNHLLSVNNLPAPPTIPRKMAFFKNYLASLLPYSPPRICPFYALLTPTHC